MSTTNGGRTLQMTQAWIRRSVQLPLLLALVILAAACADGDGESSGTEGEKPGVTLGIMCLRSGIGAESAVTCDAIADWFEMRNSEGGVEGRQVETLDEDVRYEVPRTLEVYAQWKDEVAVIWPPGTGLVFALKEQSEADQIPLLAAGIGVGAASDGGAFPYTFLSSAAYPAQFAAIGQWIMDDWESKGESGPPRVGYIGWDNPGGKEPVPYIEALASELGYEFVKRVFIAPEAVDASSQVNTISGADPDYVLTCTSGGTSVFVLRDYRRAGVEAPLIGCGSAYFEEIKTQLGDAAEGYMFATYHALEEDTEPYQMMADWWDEQGGPPEEFPSAWYARGLALAQIFEEGIRQADAIAGDGEITGEIYKQGWEAMEAFTGMGVLPETSMSAEDHQGTRQVRLYEVSGGTETLVKDWFEGPPVDAEG